MKKKVLLQVMGAVLVAGLMAGCGGTNDTKKEENTKTEAAADNADAKEETDSTRCGLPSISNLRSREPS